MSDDVRPEVFLQWKGTDACLDLYCTCGKQFHFDGYFADELTCGNCGQTWELPHMLQPEAIEPSRGFKIVFDGCEVIGDGEFGIPWPARSSRFTTRSRTAVTARPTATSSVPSLTATGR